MKINESCKDWTMEYDGPDLAGLSIQELENLTNILHIAGDAVASLATFKKDDPMRSSIIFAYHMMASNFRMNVHSFLEDVFTLRAWTVPLEKEFDPEELFGGDLKTLLFDATLSDTEKLTAEASFPTREDLDPFQGMELDPEEEDEEEDDEDEGDLLNGI